MDPLIANIKQLIRLGDGEEDLVTRLFTESVLQPGKYFLESGKICRSVAFIVRGLLRYFVTQDGVEKTFYFSREGEWVCNYRSFLPRIPSDSAIQAVEETVIRVVSYDGLQEFYRGVGEGERFGRLAIEQVFLTFIEQVRSLYADGPAQRYQQFLSSYPDLAQRIPQYHIASYVGVKPQSLSRIRKRLSGG